MLFVKKYFHSVIFNASMPILPLPLWRIVVYGTFKPFTNNLFLIPHKLSTNFQLNIKFLLLILLLQSICYIIIFIAIRTIFWLECPKICLPVFIKSSPSNKTFNNAHRLIYICNAPPPLVLWILQVEINKKPKRHNIQFYVNKLLPITNQFV